MFLTKFFSKKSAGIIIAGVVLLLLLNIWLVVRVYNEYRPWSIVYFTDGRILVGHVSLMNDYTLRLVDVYAITPAPGSAPSIGKNFKLESALGERFELIKQAVGDFMIDRSQIAAWGELARGSPIEMKVQALAR